MGEGIKLAPVSKWKNVFLFNKNVLPFPLFEKVMFCTEKNIVHISCSIWSTFYMNSIQKVFRMFEFIYLFFGENILFEHTTIYWLLLLYRLFKRVRFHGKSYLGGLQWWDPPAKANTPWLEIRPKSVFQVNQFVKKHLLPPLSKEIYYDLLSTLKEQSNSYRIF